MNHVIQPSENSTIQLHYEDFVSAKTISSNTTLVCEKGLLWLTSKDDLRDYILHPGDKLVIKKKTSVLIEALSESRVSILHKN